MGFWKSLGKGLLKAAPIAAAFIPGVGPLAAMGIGAATGAASGALSGGKKGALLGGIEGGAAGYGGSKAVKGLGPTTSVMDKVKTGAKIGLGGNQGYGDPGIGGIIGKSPEQMKGDFADMIMGHINDYRQQLPQEGNEGTTRQPIGPSTDVARDREVLDFGGALARGRRQAIRERPRRGRRQIMNAY